MRFIPTMNGRFLNISIIKEIFSEQDLEELTWDVFCFTEGGQSHWIATKFKSENIANEWIHMKVNT